MHPKGVVHVGANEGQEAADYFKAGTQYTLWIEPIPDVFSKLKENVKKHHFKDSWCLPYLISDVDGEIVDFNIANNEGQSSSMLAFGTHSQMHPTVKFVNTVQLKTKRIDTIFNDLQKEAKHFDPSNYDFLNVDVQGAELKVLKGMGEYLNGFKWLYLEVNKAELYKLCPMVEEIDEYVGQYGFKRVETKWTGAGWGDGYYKK